jgi:hypothetical protein
VQLVQWNNFVPNVFQLKLMPLSWKEDIAKSLPPGSVRVRISSHGVSHVDWRDPIIFRMSLDVEVICVRGKLMYT